MTSDRLGVYFLDVGQGDCTFVLPPGGEGDPLLCDCADSYVAERFVANHGIERLSAVVASHLDQDHVRGLLPFLRNHFAAGREVRRLVIGLDRPPKHNQAAYELVKAALRWERQPPHPDFELMPPFRQRNPVTLASGTGWKIELVLPWYGTAMAGQMASAANVCSVVLRISRGDTAVLIGGDATLGSWERLEASLLPAWAIRTPHHGGDLCDGSSRWTYSNLYQAVNARMAVTSVGSQNRYGHPRPEHLTAARRGGECRVVCTQLTPRCHPDLASIRSDALRLACTVEFPYRHRVERGQGRNRPAGEVPCAGTVALWIDAAGGILTVPAGSDWHQELVDRLDHPLCRASS